MLYVQERARDRGENVSHREPQHNTKKMQHKREKCNNVLTHALRTQQDEVAGFRSNDVGLAKHMMEVKLHFGILRRQTRQGHGILNEERTENGGKIKFER